MTHPNIKEWQEYIAEAVKTTPMPSHSETIKPLTLDDEHLGSYKAARKRKLQFTLNQL